VVQGRRPVWGGETIPDASSIRGIAWRDDQRPILYAIPQTAVFGAILQ